MSGGPQDTEARIQRLEGRMEQRKTDHEALNRRLFGNGQPGNFDRIEEKLDRLKSSLSRVTLVVAATTGIGGGAAGYIINALTGQ